MICYILSQWQGDIDGLPPLTSVVGVLLCHYRCRKPHQIEGIVSWCRDVRSLKSELAEKLAMSLGWADILEFAIAIHTLCGFGVLVLAHMQHISTHGATIDTGTLNP